LEFWIHQINIEIPANSAILTTAINITEISDLASRKTKVED